MLRPAVADKEKKKTKKKKRRRETKNAETGALGDKRRYFEIYGNISKINI